MLCLHHTDPDGWCSAAILQKYFKDEEIKFYGITYGDEVPYDLVELNEDVFVVDYSLTPEQWNKLYLRTPNVYWFDHHKTVIEDPKQPHHLKGVRKNGVAACELLWNYFFPKDEAPYTVKLTGDWDVWKFEHDPDTKHFFHGINGYPEANQPGSETWRELLSPGTPEYKEHLASMLHRGQIIKQHIDRSNKSLVKNKSNTIWFEGLRVCVVNSQVYGSPVFDSVDPDTYDGLAVYSWNGRFWKISFYTTHDHIDMSKIAVIYGGGGHRAACGCELKRLPFNFTNIVKYDEAGNAIIPRTTIGSRIRRWAMHRWCRRRVRKN